MPEWTDGHWIHGSRLGGSSPASVVYTVERWWYVAQIPVAVSRGELTVQGLFLRTEWGF